MFCFFRVDSRDVSQCCYLKHNGRFLLNNMAVKWNAHWVHFGWLAPPSNFSGKLVWLYIFSHALMQLTLICEHRQRQLLKRTFWPLVLPITKMEGWRSKQALKIHSLRRIISYSLVPSRWITIYGSIYSSKNTKAAPLCLLLCIETVNERLPWPHQWTHIGF